MTLHQHEIDELLALLRRSELPPLARVTLCYLRLAYGERAEPSKETLGRELGVDARTMRSVYQVMRAAGLIRDVEGKSGGHRSLQVELRLVHGGSIDPGSRVQDGSVDPGRADPPVLPGRILGSGQGGSVDPGRADPRIRGSDRIDEEELKIDPPPEVPASEEEANSLRSPRNTGELVLGLAMDRDLEAMLPGSTVEQRVERILEGSEKVGSNGRPFIQLDAPPTVLRLQVKKHFRYCARDVLRDQAAGAGPIVFYGKPPRLKPPAPPAPTPDVDYEIGDADREKISAAFAKGASATLRGEP